MNSLRSLDEPYREYSLAPTDDLIRFWRSKVKVTEGVEMAKTSALMLAYTSPSSNLKDINILEKECNSNLPNGSMESKLSHIISD